MIHLAKNVELWPVERLIPYEKNARTHDAAQVAKIAASMLEFGFTNPILVDSKDGIIAGHGRLMAAKEVGLAEVPVIVLDHLSDAQRRAYVLADNKLAMLSDWDEGLLASELADLQGDGFDLDVIGFTDEELAELLDEPEVEQSPSGDEDAVPEPPVEPVTVLGDVWLLGKHRLMCGDSTSLGAVEVLMAGCRADMLLTDPPYNVAYEGKTRAALKIENDSKDDGEFRQFLRDAFVTADAVMREGGAFYIWYADRETHSFSAAAVEAGWKIRAVLVWVKNTMVLGRGDYRSKHEPCLYGWKDGAAHSWESDRKQTTVLNFDKPSRNGEHPTMKPVELFEYQMLNNTRKGDIVLDLFGGSGTTAMAAEKNSRKACIMELDPRYCDVIVKRWQDFTGKKATLESTGETFDAVAAERQSGNDNSIGTAADAA